MFETIVALATPPLKSALAIIRISGDDTFNVLSKCFSKDVKNIDKRTLLVGSILDNGNKIDDVVVCLYKGPKSFTGEDSAEIICHGSMLIANQILECLIKNGARLANNGEYSSRAYMHNKIDLIQAESINDLINATTGEAKNLALLSLDGKVSELVKPVKEKIADILSLIEVNIDYPEYEDIEVANKIKIVSTIDKINQQIDILISDSEKAIVVKDGLKVAIVGKPNVGKSSLLNALLGENKAIVTNVAGTTRDVVEGDINLKGITLHLLDTAGIRDATDTIENIGVEKSKESINKADLVIVVLDASEELDKDDQEILDLTNDSKRIVVYNKADKTHNKDDKLYISALNNDINPLVECIYQTIGIDDRVFKTPALSNTRQQGLLKQAKQSLLKAKEDALNDFTVDLISVSLFEAYEAILNILGEGSDIDISKEIFKRFCVGK